MATGRLQGNQAAEREPLLLNGADGWLQRDGQTVNPVIVL